MKVLQSGATDDDSVMALLPLLKAKMYEHGFDGVRKLFLLLDVDRNGTIHPREFFEVMSTKFGVTLSPEQVVRLLEPFDLDYNGQLDYNEFAKWIAMWEPTAEDSWQRGGLLEERLNRKDGAGTGRVGRLHRLLQMIDQDHDGKIQAWEFVHALSTGDDYDRPVMGGGGGNMLGSGRLNADGSLKLEYDEEAQAAAAAAAAAAKAALHADLIEKKKSSANPGDDVNHLLHRIAARLHSGGPSVGRAFVSALTTASESEVAAGKKAKAAEAAAEAAEAAESGVCFMSPSRKKTYRAPPRDAVTAAQLGTALVAIGMDEPAALVEALVDRFGVMGSGVNEGVKVLPVWLLMQMIAEHDLSDVDGTSFDRIPDRPEGPAVVRRRTKKVSAAEKARIASKAEEDALEAERVRALIGDDSEGGAGGAGGAGALDERQLRMRLMNDNAMIQQLRDELFERSTEMAGMWKRMDQDGSGFISLLEFRKGLQRSGFTDSGHHHMKGLDRDTLSVSVEDTVRLFNYFDNDGDGTLSHGEFMQLLQNSKFIDASHNMVVGEDELTVTSAGHV